jgi:hypothetical protein
MRTSPVRLLCAAAAIVAVVLFVVPVAGSGNDKPTPVQAAFPNGLPAGGVAIDADTVSFDGGNVLLQLGPTSFDQCPSTWVCLWHDSNYLGRMLQFHDITTYWQNLTDYGFNDQMSSWRNRNTVDAKWSYDVGGGGTQRCMDAGASASSVGGDNDEASAIRIFGSSTIC